MSKTKYCPRCYITKPVNQFSFCHNTKDKLQGYCKTCKSEEHKLYRKNNPNMKEQERIYERRRHQKIVNGEMPHRRQAKLIRDRNSKLIKRISISKMLKINLTVQEKTFMKLFGCSSRVFIARFERYFEKNPGMGWHNYGAWHMDHIKPMKEFALDTEANKKLCNHYTNLRPMWATANIKKAYKYEMEQKI